jgi:hypothetical protein
MPKISEFGGPTDESQPGYYEKGRSAQSPNVVATDPEVVGEEQAARDNDSREGEDVSAGSNSSSSPTPTGPSETNARTENPSNAPSMAGPSKPAPKGNSTARTTGGRGAGRN